MADPVHYLSHDNDVYVARGLVAALERGLDDRKAWIVGGWINLNAIKKLRLTSEPESPLT